MEILIVTHSVMHLENNLLELVLLVDMAEEGLLATIFLAVMVAIQSLLLV